MKSSSSSMKAANSLQLFTFFPSYSYTVFLHFCRAFYIPFGNNSCWESRYYILMWKRFINIQLNLCRQKMCSDICTGQTVRRQLLIDFGFIVMARLGNPGGVTHPDGRKLVCLDQFIAPVFNNCHIYSFGLNNHWTFDEDIWLRLAATFEDSYCCLSNYILKYNLKKRMNLYLMNLISAYETIVFFSLIAAKIMKFLN